MNESWNHFTAFFGNENEKIKMAALHLLLAFLRLGEQSLKRIEKFGFIEKIQEFLEPVFAQLENLAAKEEREKAMRYLKQRTDLVLLLSSIFECILKYKSEDRVVALVEGLENFPDEAVQLRLLDLNITFFELF